MIVWLASYPRSGNSFVHIAPKHFLHLGTRTVCPNAVNLDVHRMRELVGEPAAEMPLEGIANTAEPCLVKTHETWFFRNGKAGGWPERRLRSCTGCSGSAMKNQFWRFITRVTALVDVLNRVMNISIITASSSR